MPSGPELLLELPHQARMALRGRHEARVPAELRQLAQQVARAGGDAVTRLRSRRRGRLGAASTIRRTTGSTAANDRSPCSS